MCVDVCVDVWVCVCVHACVGVCVRACVCVCVWMCVWVLLTVCVQMAMIGVCGNVVAQTVSNATKILTATIVPEVANVPLPSRSVWG